MHHVIHNCVFCHTQGFDHVDHIQVVQQGGWMWVRCDECGFRTPMHVSEYAAVVLWNEIQQALVDGKVEECDSTVKERDVSEDHQSS